MEFYGRVGGRKVIRVIGGLFGMLITLISLGCGSDPTYSISGRVTAGGSALPGVTVTLSGNFSKTATTDANGAYTLSDVPVGIYQVTPSFSNFIFIPISRTAWIDGIDGTGFDFSVFSENKMALTNHTVYLKNDGTVWTWGNNSNGQLGYTTIEQSSSSPAQVSGLSGVAAVAAGNDFTVVLKGDGTVWAWGNNNKGQLGDGTLTQRTSPVQVMGLTGVKAIAAGYGHALALRSDGTLQAWGNNSNGQLGNGNTTDSSVPVPVTGLSNVTAMAAGFAHTVALINNDTVMAWGSNSNGQLGNGNTTDSLTPVKAGTLTRVIAIAAGYVHTVALKNELTAFSVWTWGSNGKGQLGNGTTTDSSAPLRINSLTIAVALAAGNDYTVVRNSDGTVWTWGNNSNGQLGDGTTVQKTRPVQVAGLSGAETIGAGYGHTIALGTGGNAWAWGKNSFGQLGVGTTTDSAIPVPLVQP